MISRESTGFSSDSPSAALSQALTGVFSSDDYAATVQVIVKGVTKVGRGWYASVLTLIEPKPVNGLKKNGPQLDENQKEENQKEENKRKRREKRSSKTESKGNNQHASNAQLEPTADSHQRKMVLATTPSVIIIVNGNAQTKKIVGLT